MKCYNHRRSTGWAYFTIRNCPGSEDIAGQCTGLALLLQLFSLLLVQSKAANSHHAFPSLAGRCRGQLTRVPFLSISLRTHMANYSDFDRRINVEWQSGTNRSNLIINCFARMITKKSNPGYSRSWRLELKVASRRWRDLVGEWVGMDRGCARPSGGATPGPGRSYALPLKK